MTNDAAPTTVVIIGTMHLPPEEYPEFGKWLSAAIEEIAPDVICAELSPEQLAGTQSCDSKPEQRDIVIPTAKRLGIPIMTFQPRTADALEWQDRLTAIDREMREQDPYKHYLTCLDNLAMKEAELWQQHMKSADCIEDLQLNEYHVFCEARDRTHAELMPKHAKLFEEWNEFFLADILEAIEKNKGNRLLIIAGNWHKYWLHDKLQQEKAVTVHNLQSYRESLRS